MLYVYAKTKRVVQDHVLSCLQKDRVRANPWHTLCAEQLNIESTYIFSWGGWRGIDYTSVYVGIPLNASTYPARYRRRRSIDRFADYLNRHSCSYQNSGTRRGLVSCLGFSPPFARQFSLNFAYSHINSIQYSIYTEHTVSAIKKVGRTPRMAVLEAASALNLHPAATAVLW